TVKRGAEIQDYDVVTEELVSRVGEEMALERWGLSVRRVSRAYARENQLSDDDGVVVIGVQRGFPAQVAGLSPGDVITKINQKTIDSLDVLVTAHEAYMAEPEPVLVEARRNFRVSLYVLKP